MDIGTRKQLFMDERFVETSEGVRWCMNPPHQHADPVLVCDRPWERLGICGYNTVMKEGEGRFRLWYGATRKMGLPQEGAIRLGYAESEDGRHWTKPSLGLISYEGSNDNNLVAPLEERQSMQGATVYRDDRAPETERYKLWSKFQPTDKQVAAGVLPGLWAMRSPDGIHWEVYEDQPSPRQQMCDTQNMFFWDDRIGQYAGYTRVRETQRLDEAAEAGGRGKYRSIGRITSPDFRTWSKTQVVLEADDDDLNMPVPDQRDDPRPNIDVYTSCAMKYASAEDVYLMMPSFFYHWGEDDHPATMDVQLLTSRDGIHWDRKGERRPFLRLGFEGSTTGGMLFANPWLIPMGNELWLYYTGTAHTHGARAGAPVRNGLFLSTMRRDGFVSLDAGYGGGAFRTPVLQFAGDRLEVNFDGSAGGWLKVEIQDADGKPLPGYALSDADGLVGNGIRKTITWKGRTGVGGLAGRPVRLRFVMRDAKLYAFQFPLSRA